MVEANNLPQVAEHRGTGRSWQRVGQVLESRFVRRANTVVTTNGDLLHVARRMLNDVQGHTGA